MRVKYGYAGCGTGFGVSCLRKQYPGAHITGVDLSPNMVNVARRSGQATHSLTGDIEALPLPSNSFDLSVSSSAIQWCEIAQALSEIVRVTKPNGRILISSFLEGTLASWRSLWGRQNQQYFLSYESLQAALRDSGLEIVTIWREVRTQRFTSFDSAVDSIRNLGAGDASPSRIPMTREKLGKIKRGIDKIIERQGTIELDYRVVYVNARKPG